MRGADRCEGRPLASAIHQRLHRGEGRDVPSGEQSLVHQDQEVVPEGDQGSHRSCQALGDRHGGQVGLGEVAFGLTEGLVEGGAQAWRVG